MEMLLVCPLVLPDTVLIPIKELEKSKTSLSYLSHSLKACYGNRLKFIVPFCQLFVKHFVLNCKRASRVNTAVMDLFWQPAQFELKGTCVFWATKFKKRVKSTVFHSDPSQISTFRSGLVTHFSIFLFDAWSFSQRPSVEWKQVSVGEDLDVEHLSLCEIFSFLSQSWIRLE